jgi:hypothetical protein
MSQRCGHRISEKGVGSGRDIALLDERDLGRVRPDLREVQINSIHSVGVLLGEVVDCHDVTPRAGVGLGGGERGHETENSGEQKAGAGSQVCAVDVVAHP